MGIYCWNNTAIISDDTANLVVVVVVTVGVDVH